MKVEVLPFGILAKRGSAGLSLRRHRVLFTINAAEPSKSYPDLVQQSLKLQKCPHLVSKFFIMVIITYL
jgi:hypothetical protein